MKIPAIVAARTSIKNTLPRIKTRINNAYNPVNPALPYVNRGAEVSRQKTKINSINEFLFNKVEIIRFNRKHLPPFSAWYINPDNSSNVVFYIHGLGANITNYQNLYEKLLKKNVGIFAVEYRGHGENPKARVNESKIENDLERAYQYLIHILIPCKYRLENDGKYENDASRFYFLFLFIFISHVSYSLSVPSSLKRWLQYPCSRGSSGQRSERNI